MKKLTLSALLAASVFAPLAANAADTGLITFAGSLTTSTCSAVVSGGAASDTVNIPSASSSALDASGKEAGGKDFTIDLTGCSLPAARAYFTSTANVDTTTGNLKNTAPAGTGVDAPATNVQLAIYRMTGTPKKLNLSLGGGAQDDTAGDVTLTGTGTARTGKLPYRVVYAATGAAGAGKVASTVTYNVDNH